MKASLMLVAAFALSSFAAQSIEVNRFSLFPRLSIQGNFGSSPFGYFALADLRYAPTYEKSVNDKVVDSTAREIWRNDLIMGPSWNTTVKSAPLSIKLLYHPMWNNISEAVEKEYLRHSAEIQADLMHKAGNRVKVRYRIIGMNWFSGETGEGKALGNEFYTRLLAGVIVPINKQFQLIFDEEVFVKFTADDSDLDGTERFHKNVIWAGGQWKPSDLMTLKLQYVHTVTNQEQSDLRTVKAIDPSVMVHAAFAIPRPESKR